MTIEELMYGTAQACIDEREAHLIMFTHGLNGYVCRNKGIIAESKAVFVGTYRDCQIWVERRGLSAALRFVREHRVAVPELSGGGLTVAECLEIISRLPADR